MEPTTVETVKVIFTVFGAGVSALWIIYVFVARSLGKLGEKVDTLDKDVNRQLVRIHREYVHKEELRDLAKRLESYATATTQRLDLIVSIVTNTQTKGDK